MTEHRLGPDDAGRRLDVAAGDRVVLALPEIAGTGYTWTVEDLPPGSRVVEEHYDLPHAGAIGGAAQHVFVLAAPDGPGTLRLRHARPWEGDAEALERFEVALGPPS